MEANGLDLDGIEARYGFRSDDVGHVIGLLVAEVRRLRAVSAAQPYEAERELAEALDRNIAVKHAVAAERDVLRAQRDAVLALCKNLSGVHNGVRIVSVESVRRCLDVTE